MSDWQAEEFDKEEKAEALAAAIFEYTRTINILSFFDKNFLEEDQEVIFARTQSEHEEARINLIQRFNQATGCELYRFGENWYVGSKIVF